MRNRHVIFALVAAIGLGCTISNLADAEDEVGIAVGKPAPSFTLQNQEGKRIDSRDLLKRGPLAVVFYRSADW